MNTLSSLLNFIGNKIGAYDSWKSKVQSPITANTSSKEIPSEQFTELCRVTLPVGKYIILAYGGTGVTTGTVTGFGVSLQKVSGSGVVTLGSEVVGTAFAGNPHTTAGYVEATSENVIQLRGYLYGQGRAQNGFAWIVAVPIA